MTRACSFGFSCVCFLRVFVLMVASLSYCGLFCVSDVLFPLVVASLAAGSLPGQRTTWKRLG